MRRRSFISWSTGLAVTGTIGGSMVGRFLHPTFASAVQRGDRPHLNHHHGNVLITELRFCAERCEVLLRASTARMQTGHESLQTNLKDTQDLCLQAVQFVENGKAVAAAFWQALADSCERTMERLATPHTLAFELKHTLAKVSHLSELQIRS